MPSAASTRWPTAASAWPATRRSPRSTRPSARPCRKTTSTPSAAWSPTSWAGTRRANRWSSGAEFQVMLTRGGAVRWFRVTARRRGARHRCRLMAAPEALTAANGLWRTPGMVRRRAGPGRLGGRRLGGCGVLRPASAREWWWLQIAAGCWSSPSGARRRSWAPSARLMFGRLAGQSGLWWLYISMHRYGDGCIPAGCRGPAGAGLSRCTRSDGAGGFARWATRAGGSAWLFAACWLLAELAGGCLHRLPVGGLGLCPHRRARWRRWRPGWACMAWALSAVLALAALAGSQAPAAVGIALPGWSPGRGCTLVAAGAAARFHRRPACCGDACSGQRPQDLKFEPPASAAAARPARGRARRPGGHALRRSLPFPPCRRCAWQTVAGLQQLPSPGADGAPWSASSWATSPAATSIRWWGRPLGRRSRRLPLRQAHPAVRRVHPAGSAGSCALMNIPLGDQARGRCASRSSLAGSAASADLLRGPVRRGDGRRGWAPARRRSSSTPATGLVRHMDDPGAAPQHSRAQPGVAAAWSCAPPTPARRW